MDDHLIEEVRQNPCLYSLEDSNYKNLFYKEKVWATIAERLNIDVEQCKKRWRNLRDTKRRSYNRMQLPSGSAAPTKGPWIHADAMAFLDDTKCCRRTIGSLPQPEGLEDQDKEPIPDFSPPMAPHIALLHVSPQVSDSSPLPSPSPVPSPSPSPSPGFSHQTSWQRRKMRKEANEKAEFNNFLSAASGTINSLTSSLAGTVTTKTSTTRLYFAAMAEELEEANLPPEMLRSTTDECRRYIRNIIDSYKQNNSN